MKDGLPSSLDTGHAAENKARAHLEAKGYKFLCANFRTRLGELDLVMKQKDTVVFVEVKARKNLSFGLPFEAVTVSKQHRITKAALEYIKQKNLQGTPARFDVVSIDHERVEHLENAFSIAAGRYTL
jgi:putative endonuclease